MRLATDPTRRASPGRLDPRVYQIASLAGLLAYGVLGLDFDVPASRAAVLVGTALLAQLVFSRARGLRFEARSAAISGLSLCLLLRTDSLLLAAAAAFAAVASKFLVRWNGKHVFNPTNFGLVALMAATDRVWVSPGQWGSVAFFAFLTACLGGLVVNRAARSDVTGAFLASYVAMLFGRALWLGDPVAIPLHQLQSGALLIFAFFMISDPKTTPDSRAGRIAFALLVTAGAGWVRFGLFRTNGLLWSLAACALAVPLIDRLLPGRRYAWASSGAVGDPKGVPHVPALDLVCKLPGGQPLG
jgi:enediyne biosynthesis protein E5